MGISEFIKKKLDSMYVGRCKVIKFGDIEEDGIIIGQSESILLENVHCRISFKTASLPQNMEANIDAVLFLSNEYEIPMNSNIIVKQNGVEYKFVSSGLAKKYDYHQEIALKSDIYA